MEKVLEVCVDSFESAREAVCGGATRLELCSNLIIGGTTPSLSLLSLIKHETDLSVPVNCLLRPRAGDFLYTDREFDLMLSDAALLLEWGADALVSGCLTEDGDLDLARTERLAALCHQAGRRFTLHRAFDMCRDPLKTLEECKALGVDTILTSGQADSCRAGAELIGKLMDRADSVEILIGGGVDAGAIRQIRAAVPAAGSFHMSGKRVMESGMRYRKEGVSMGLPGLSEYEIWRTDREKISLARKELFG